MTADESTTAIADASTSSSSDPSPDDSTSTSEADTSSSSASAIDTTESSGEGTIGICGDGIVGGDEECDDGNAEIEDGCTPECIDEPGWFAQIDPPEGSARVFTSVAIAADGSVIAAGVEQVFGSEDLATIVAKYSADGTLLGESRIVLDVATYASTVTALASGDALVVVAAGPEYVLPSIPYVLRVTPGSAEPTWVTALSDAPLRAPTSIALRDDGVAVVPVAGSIDAVPTRRLVAVDEDGGVAWDREIGGPVGASHRCHSARDGGDVMAVCIAYEGEVANVEQSAIASDGDAELLDAWSVDGRIVNIAVMDGGVLIVGYTPDSGPMLAYWADGAEQWALLPQGDGRFNSVAFDEIVVVTGTVFTRGNMKQLVYLELSPEGAILEEAMPRAQHEGWGVARRAGVSAIGGALDLGLRPGPKPDLNYQVTAAWLHATDG